MYVYVRFFPACAPVHVFAGPPRPGESAGAGGLRRRDISGSRGKGGGIPAVRGQTHTFYRGLTDESGIVQGIALPGPARPPGPRRPDTASISGTGYLVSVRHPLFVPQEDREVTVYARIESILPVMLEPVI